MGANQTLARSRCKDTRHLDLFVPATGSLASTPLESDFAHAANGTIRVDIKFPPIDDDPSPWWYQLFDLTVLRQSHRWSSFTYDLSEVMDDPERRRSFSSISILPKNVSLRALQEVELRSVHGLKEINFFRAIGQSPVLRKLVLIDVRDIARLVSEIPWHQLVHLEFREHLAKNVYPNSLFTTILPKCTKLEVFATQDYLWRRHPSPHIPHSAAIVDLDLRGHNPHNRDVIHTLATHLRISPLSLPSLQKLTIQGSNLLDPAIQMIETSSCSLTTLFISHIYLADVTVIRLLRATRGTLRKLTLQGDFTGHLLSCLASESDDPPVEENTLLPRLEVLVIGTFMLVNMSRYKRIVGVLIPDDLSRCWYHSLRVSVDCSKQEATFSGEGSSDILTRKGLGPLKMAVAMPLTRLTENMAVVDSILTYIEEHSWVEQIDL
ncbi:hypothetical protein V5O48_012710, partial [Marasmius crinis-equi]